MTEIKNKLVKLESLKVLYDTILNSRGGYIEFQNGVLNLYSDSSKTRKLSSTVISVGGGGSGDVSGEVLTDIVNQLNNKTIKTRIDFDGDRTFKIGTRTLNYKELYETHLLQSDFAFVVYGDRAYLLSYVQSDTSAMREMRFQSVIATTDSNNISKVKVSGIYVKSSDGVNIASVSITDINSENSSYKATAITDTNKNDIWYPTTKAVADYVDAHCTTKEELSNIVDQYFRENPVTGVTSDMIANAVEDYLTEHPVQGDNYDHAAIETALQGINGAPVTTITTGTPTRLATTKAVVDYVKNNSGNDSLIGTGNITTEMARALWDLLEVKGYVSDDVEEVRDRFKRLWAIDTDTPVTPTLNSITVTWSATSAGVGTSTQSLISSVMANYSDGSSQTVTGYTVSPSTLAEGSQTVTVTYSGKTATKTITGTASQPTRTLQSISATYTGGAVDVGTPATSLTGITVTAHYNVAPLTETVTGWSISGTVAEGSNTFTISYSGKTTTINVTGNAVDIPEEPTASKNILKTEYFNTNQTVMQNSGSLYLSEDSKYNTVIFPVESGKTYCGMVNGSYGWWNTPAYLLEDWNGVSGKLAASAPSGANVFANRNPSQVNDSNLSQYRIVATETTKYVAIRIDTSVDISKLMIYNLTDEGYITTYEGYV